VEVYVTIPADAADGATDDVTVTATSQGDPTESDAATLTTTVVTAVYGVEVTPPTAGQNGEVGSVVTYTLTVTNTGNLPDTFGLTVEGNVWTTTLSEPSVTLAAGASTTVEVYVTIPADAADGATDEVTVTATSQGDPDVSASATLTTTSVVPEPETFELYLPIIFKPGE
jgi:uncharacterized membrane protein